MQVQLTSSVPEPCKNQSGNQHLSVLSTLKCLFANQQSFQQQLKKLVNLNWVERGRYHSPLGTSSCNLLHQKFAEIWLSPWYHFSDLVLLSELMELSVQQENKADSIFIYWNKIMRSLFCVALVACCVNTYARGILFLIKFISLWIRGELRCLTRNT